MFWIRTKQITVPKALALMEEGNPLLVDVRKPKDYETDHIEGAILANRDTIHEEIRETDKDRPIICYCYSGVSSRVACKNLKKAGFNQVFNLKGGFWAWNHNQEKTGS